MKRLWLIFIVLFLAGSIILSIIFFSRLINDKWVCKSGEWVRVGNPIFPKPDVGCTSEIVEKAKENLDDAQQCLSEGGSMTYKKAKEIANQGCKDGILLDEHSCNTSTGTWWIGFEPDEPKDGCNPACVVDIATQKAEINWRCTGLKP